MRPPTPPTALAWIAVPLLALGFLLWVQSAQRARVDYVTHAVPSDATLLATSPTGYAGEIRELVLPEQNSDSAHWIAQTQQMLATGELRVRRIDYENAPFGRDEPNPSPYRWWLGLVAHADHFLSARPVGKSVERAALYADPLWHLLLLAAAAGFTAWQFGLRSAALLSLGLAGLFPLATAFPAGLPNDATLSHAGTLASLLFLTAGLLSPRDPVRWFFAAGFTGGLGLWLNVAETVPVILGLALGAVAAAWFGRKLPNSVAAGLPLPVHWLTWSLGGAASSLVCYLVEYFPDHLGSWQLRTNHPLYSLAWLGLGAGLFQVNSRLRPDAPRWNLRHVAGLLLAIAAIAPLPVLMAKNSDPGFLAVDLWSFRLTRLPGTAEATSLLAWMTRDRLSVQLWAALLPVLIVLPAGWLMLSKLTSDSSRTALIVILGPVLLGAGLACWQLGRWSSADVCLLALVVVVTVALPTAARPSLAPAWWAVVLVLLITPGVFQFWPTAKKQSEIPLNEVELSGLIARDLAHWLAQHRAPGPAVVLAPPNETAAFSYYGGLRGIATLSWKNEAGITAAVRILSATSPEEALALIQNRGVTHIVIPSWDNYLSEYVRLGGGPVDQSFLTGLRNWALPPWLRPVAYQLPSVPGYQDQSVAIFAVVEEQDEALSLSRLADYFVEMGRLDYASQISQALQKFPLDLSAGIARAQVAVARRDEAGLTQALQAIAPKVATGADRWLPWDRRVSLAVVLAQGRQLEPARDQVGKCLAAADEAKLRTASTASLYRLLLLAKRFGLEIADPALRQTARELLPVDSRAQL